MRRSAAPSQLHAAKRTKFTVPFKTNASIPNVQSAAVTYTERKLNTAVEESPIPQKGTPNSVDVIYSLDDKASDKSSLSETDSSKSQQQADSGLKKVLTEEKCIANKCVRSPLKPFNIGKGSPSHATASTQHPNECSGSRGPPENRVSSSSLVRFKTPLATLERLPTSDKEQIVHCGYFSVVWCKLSRKKHKKWEGDAVLVTNGRQVTLYDMDGKEIGKGSGYKSSELESLAEDETLTIGGKEIQVMSKLSEDLFRSGKCFTGATAVTSQGGCSPVREKSTPEYSKSFINPVLKQNSLKSETSVSRIQNVAPRFDPLAPDALVMPRPNTAHQQRYHTNNGVEIVDVVVDPHLSYHLRPHQRQGVRFLYECVMGMRDYGGAGAILADDMGLGKTLQCISLIWTLLKQGMYGGKPPVKKVIIITPGSLVKNWSAEFRKWLGPERLQVYAVASDNRVEDFVKTAVYPVLIISYEMFVRGYDTMKTVPWDLVVCDEGHRLKNTTIKTTSLISSLDARRRVVLSGTPIQNDLQEFFAVVDFCNPGILGNSAAFRRVYEEPIVTSRQPGATKTLVALGEERAAELSRLTGLFVLRRTQEINNKYLPPKAELVLFCRPSTLQRGVYREVLRSGVVRACLAGRGCGMGGQGAPHLLAISTLKQVCSHPSLIAPKLQKAALDNSDCADSFGDGDKLFVGVMQKYHEEITSGAVSPEHSGKLAALAIILANIFTSFPQEKVVLISNHTKTLDLLQQFCRNLGYKFLRLDGQTPTAQRQQIVRRFNSSYGDEKVFLLSSKAGGVGLNLVGASRLFLYDIDWNPANDLQAMARVWRDGQKKEVHIYRLLTTGSLEEKVYQRQISKQGLSGAVMDLKASDIQFSQEDLKDLFSFSEGTDCDTHALLGCPCQGRGDTEPISLPSAVDPQNNTPGHLAKKASNLSMAELLEWQHLQGNSPLIHKDWCLEGTEDTVSFLFWHKSNADNHNSK